MAQHSSECEASRDGGPGLNYSASGWFRVSGLGFWVQGLGFRASGLGFRVSGLGLWVQGLGFRASGLGFRVSGLGFFALLTTGGGGWVA